jgi:hypothetical protein
MTGDPAQQKTIRKEMGITHKEFYAELPVLLDNIPYRQHLDTISFQLHGKHMEIILGPEELRAVGPTVRLPVTVVTLCFHDFTEQEVRDFVRHFNLRFMKGGG